MGEPLRVGLVGASLARSGWAIVAHAPAIRALDELTLQAVATTKRASADEAARALGAVSAYDSAEALAADPDVELVVVGVKVAVHEPVVRAAVAAGKHVLCEWPLGLDTAEARELAALAQDAGVVHSIGLQARFAPAVRYARELIEEGYLGELTSVTLTGSSLMPGARELPERYADHLKAASSITVLRIPAAHAFDAVCYLAGDLDDVSARVLTLAPEVRIAETGQILPKDADDHVAFTARTGAGALVVAHMQGGSAAAIGSSIELRGPRGLLRVSTAQPQQLQMASLALSGTQAGGEPEPIEIPERFMAHLPAAVRGTFAENVAGVYRDVHDAIRNGTPVATDFALAVRRHELGDALVASSEQDSRLVRLADQGAMT